MTELTELLKASKKAVDYIISDLCGRSGGDHFYEPCDKEIQEEIKETWVRIIKQQILILFEQEKSKRAEMEIEWSAKLEAKEQECERLKAKLTAKEAEVDGWNATAKHIQMLYTPNGDLAKVCRNALDRKFPCLICGEYHRPVCKQDG